MNVNILLFCGWVAFTRRGTLSRAEIQKCQRAIMDWHQHITASLRQLRQVVGQQTQPWAPALKKSILDDELYAECVEQMLLAETLSRAPLASRSKSDRVEDAVMNMAVYAHELQCRADIEDAEAYRKILLGIFPDYSPPFHLNSWILLCLDKMTP